MTDSLIANIHSSIRDVPDFPKPGILFKDITPILKDANLCKQIVQKIGDDLKEKQPEAVIGIESRGFLFGMMIAGYFNIPFIPIRKAGRLPYKTIRHKYDLEYGSAEIEMHQDALEKGMRVLVHDDLLATGGTAGAAAYLIELQEAKLIGFSFLVELEFLKGRQNLTQFSENIHSLIKY